jgi:hypothetical protein
MTCAIGCAKQYKRKICWQMVPTKVDFDTKLATVTYDKTI